MDEAYSSTLRRISHACSERLNLAQDVRGRRVVGACGVAVGEVDDLYVDDSEGRGFCSSSTVRFRGRAWLHT